uniref:Chromodomain helicase DNA binding protein 1-like n=1 Tax=Astatotilapia calliptera TaxID=8154 RepID=A0AAX7UDE2_ASTCA
MSDILVRIKNSIAEKKKADVAQSDLKKWGLRGIQLRPYQLDGVHWLTQCLKNQQGCILGDEMGLGKTCQTISLLVYMSGALRKKGPFLVLSPLSVLENWRNELESFAPSLTVLVYNGDKERRTEIQQEANSQDFHVLLTTYELCLKDASFLKRWKWKVLVVDEAHRLKNQNSLLHKTLTEFFVGFRVLLTGTPIQNNLQELYSLLSFIQPNIFIPEDTDSFVNSYSDVQTAELQSILEPFLLRRVKSQVAVDLPKKTELVVYHGMSALQKKYYKAVLMKDLEAFGNDQGSKTRLLNILMNLRKCVDHPYLFDGVEPEPFEMGEHLIEASGKLCLLDSMLTFLHKGGHRILLFSQMTRMLDILQDYMEYRGYSYERLDGSVRGEERNLAVKNFSSKDVFVFLLSTKAGGVGMNLTAADTVIFVDSDFNPQNDLQAAARSHRIGQNRPVKVIRLLARDTVEEIMYSRAVSKLQLTNTVIEEGRFSLLDQAQSAAGGLQVCEKRKPVTEAELELRRQRREEAAAKRAKMQEEMKKKQEEQKYKKKMAWWESCGYRSRCLPSVDSEEEEEEEEDGSSMCSTDSDSTDIHYVLGDVTHPHTARGDAIIVHCVDDSGRWGRGGLFTALEVRSDEPRKQYELAGKMKDLDLGSVLLFPINDKQSRLNSQDQLALIVAQQRDKANNLSGIFLSALDEGLKKIYKAAKRTKASVHLPRIGHATKGFNWYGTERLIRKHLASRGIPTFIPAFPNKQESTLHSTYISSDNTLFYWCVFKLRH